MFRQEEHEDGSARCLAFGGAEAGDRTRISSEVMLLLVLMESRRPRPRFPPKAEGADQARRRRLTTFGPARQARGTGVQDWNRAVCRVAYSEQISYLTCLTCI